MKSDDDEADETIRTLQKMVQDMQLVSSACVTRLSKHTISLPCMYAIVELPNLETLCMCMC